MARKPQPINGENAEEAEARLKSLRQRFGRVSGRYGRVRNNAGAVSANPSVGGRRGFTFSRFEWLIAGGVVVFLLVVGGQVFGG